MQRFFIFLHVGHNISSQKSEKVQNGNVINLRKLEKDQVISSGLFFTSNV